MNTPLNRYNATMRARRHHVTAASLSKDFVFAAWLASRKRRKPYTPPVVETPAPVATPPVVETPASTAPAHERSGADVA